MKVWIALYTDYEEFGFLGAFYKEYDAFIVCLINYKERKEDLKYLDRKKSIDKFVRREIIKQLRNYELFEYEIR